VFSNNTFEDNKAQYGKDISSHPVKLSIDILNEIEIAPGSIMNQSITVSLLDNDNQLIVNDNSSRI